MNKKYIAFLLYTVFWSTFLISTGTLTSGYHLVDDQEIISFKVQLKEDGFLQSYKEIMKYDLGMRFRPLYYFERLILVAAFGTNYILWSIHNAVLAILTSFLFFLFLFRHGYGFLNSLLFPFLILIGAQSAIWWRLGPNETLGIFLLSLALFFMMDYIKSRKKYKLIVSVVSMILASLTKESFFLCIPAYLIMIFYFEYENRTFRDITKILRAYVYLILILVMVFALESYAIVNYAGLNSIGYAGLDKSTSVGSYINFFLSTVHEQYFFWVIITGILLLVIDYIYTRDLNGLKIKLTSYLFLILICAAIILPQYVLHFKSGMWERYLIPASLGFAILVIFISEELKNRIPPLLYKIYVVMILFTILQASDKADMVRTAREFARDGKSTMGFFSTIVSNTQKEDTILLIVDAISGLGYSADTYLAASERKNLKFYIYDIEPVDSFEAGLEKSFKSSVSDRVADTLDDKYPCIAVLPFKENDIIINRTDSLFSYTRKDFNDYTVFTRYNH